MTQWALLTQDIVDAAVGQDIALELYSLWVVPLL